MRDAHYIVIEMWECDFNSMVRTGMDMQNFFANHPELRQTPLDPRNAFFGGRTNAVKLYHKCKENERIHYMDVCSLYPFVNKFCKYPIGHPKLYIGHDECSKLSLDSLEGLIKCTVLPPTKLYHPVLPSRMHGKLMFYLCFTCAVNMFEGTCSHSDKERMFTGTYVADELRKAVNLGYTVVEYHEIWEYKVVQYDKDTKSGGSICWIYRFVFKNETGS